MEEQKEVTPIEIDCRGFVTKGPEGMQGASIFSNMLVPEQPDESGEVLLAAKALPCRWKQRADGSWV